MEVKLRPFYLSTPILFAPSIYSDKILKSIYTCAWTKIIHSSIHKRQIKDIINKLLDLV